MPQASDPDTQRAGARKTMLSILVVVAVMGGLSFAAVPFYDMFCRVTGFGGTPVVGQGAGQVLDQTIKVFFDANTHKDMPWEFAPEQKSVTVRLGENAMAYYTAYNPTDKVITGTASYNVTPLDLGGYFTKIDCFCFTEQTLQPGERVRMPVIFYVDPELASDEENHDAKTITLSYTFFLTESKEAETAGTTPHEPAKAGAL